MVELGRLKLDSCRFSVVMDVFDHPKSRSGLTTGSAMCYGCSPGARKGSLVFPVYFMASGLEV